MCPITHAPMRHAVVAADGFTYDNNSIVRAMCASQDLCGVAKSPMTNLPLANTQLQHDAQLQTRINEWGSTNDGGVDEDEPASPLLTPPPEVERLPDDDELNALFEGMVEIFGDALPEIVVAGVLEFMRRNNGWQPVFIERVERFGHMGLMITFRNTRNDDNVRRSTRQSRRPDRYTG